MWNKNRKSPKLALTCWRRLKTGDHLPAPVKTIFQSRPTIFRNRQVRNANHGVEPEPALRCPFCPTTGVLPHRRRSPVPTKEKATKAEFPGGR